MTVQCCKCKRLRRAGEWIRQLPQPTEGPVSHTYCPLCLDTTREAMRVPLVIPSRNA